MNDHHGFRWRLAQQGDEWIWSLVGRDDDTPHVSGAAPTRAQAAACVVRAVICGVVAETSVQQMAA